MAANPLEEAIASIDDTTVSDDLVVLALTDRPDLPEDLRQRRFLVYVGLYDLLAEASLSGLPTEREQEDLVARGMSSTIAAEPVLKFARHDRSSRAEQLELITRMRGKEIGMTDRWLVPRLELDIAAYRARIDALRRAIEERSS
jgi:hypothetical protein